MHDDTHIGGAGSRFPQTRGSAIIAARSGDAETRNRGYAALVAGYWKPVYKYIRLKWHQSNEDAKDLTQGFFAQAMEKEFFQGYDPAKARFRTFLRTCLDGYIANENKAGKRLKRGGNAQIMGLDFENAEGEIRELQLSAGTVPEDFFERESLRSLFEVALARLKEACETAGKMQHYRIFERYDLREDEAEKITYDQLAAEFDLPVSQITNHLAYVRREFRRLVLEILRELTASDEEFRSEVREVLGVDPE